MEGDCTGVAFADNVGHSPESEVLAIEPSLIRGRVLDSSGGNFLWYRSLSFWLDKGRGADGPSDIWTSSFAV